MPTTLLGLVLFIVVLAPGLVYFSVREALRERTRPDRSGFRETGEVALVSVTCDVAVLFLFFALRALRPGWTPDVGRLIANPHDYATGYYESITFWSFALLASACGLAALAAWRLPRWNRLAFNSAWWALFRSHRPPGSIPFVSCTLEDGARIRGRLFTWSADENDSPDRELTLIAPLDITAPGEMQSQVLNAQAVSVSARRIMLLTVNYLDPAVLEPPPETTQA